MNNINEHSIKFVKNLFEKISSEKLIQNSGTEIGNYKSALFEKHGIEFIEKYDLLIEKLAHEKVYTQKISN